MMVKIITERYAQQGNTLNKYEMCDALEMPRATYYRMTRIELPPVEKIKQHSPRGLTPEEEDKVLLLLNSPRFCDMAPGEIYATLPSLPILVRQKNKQNS